MATCREPQKSPRMLKDALLENTLALAMEVSPIQERNITTIQLLHGEPRCKVIIPPTEVIILMELRLILEMVVAETINMVRKAQVWLPTSTTSSSCGVAVRRVHDSLSSSPPSHWRSATRCRQACVLSHPLVSCPQPSCHPR